MNMASNSPMRRATSWRCFRQLVYQDRNEDDIVDAEHEFERGERKECDPQLRVGQQFDHKTCRSGVRYRLSDITTPGRLVK